MRNLIETDALDDPHLIRAISIHYCQQRPTASISRHIDSIVDRIATEVIHVNQLDEEQREEWCLNVTNMTISEWQDYENELYDDPEDRIALQAAYEADTDTKKYPVYDIILKTDCEPSECHEECAICQEEKPSDRFDKTQCGHSFCQECISTHLETKRYNRATCPLCRTDIMSLETTNQQCYESLYSCFSETGAFMKDCLHMWGLE
jgi:hypothetical protein